MGANDKIILPNIPIEINKDDLKIVFESNIFGFKNVTNLKEEINSNRKFKNVLFQFDSEEAAREVARKGSFNFRFGRSELTLKPHLFLENFEFKPHDSNKKDDEQNKEFKKELENLFTCWIGNIPDLYSEEKLKDFFSQEISKMSLSFHSIKPKFNPKLQKYQCFINLHSEKDAKKVVEYFHESSIGNCKLDAKLRDQSQK
ncbi:unnamed protein product [Brachionus calyciflorus]|uniref:RRM domain-containing protein n=1 Tax=Brachionus calyciflorus TaxID=104777 RepID=A0A813QYV7_9BILA|nr:unnamed protein product [Brachionus calyciflorus]